MNIPIDDGVTCTYTIKLHIFREEQDKPDDVKIVAVDLQAMAPIPGVIQIQGDITKVFHIIFRCRFTSNGSYHRC